MTDGLINWDQSVFPLTAELVIVHPFHSWVYRFTKMFFLSIPNHVSLNSVSKGYSLRRKRKGVALLVAEPSQSIDYFLKGCIISYISLQGTIKEPFPQVKLGKTLNSRLFGVCLWQKYRKVLKAGKIGSPLDSSYKKFQGLLHIIMIKKIYEEEQSQGSNRRTTCSFKNFSSNKNVWFLVK